jgi:uncharacterized membrane protein YedE/YeeE
MTSFTPFSATAGGLLIGFSTLLLLLLDGRVAGISGILGNLLTFRRGEILWRLAFIAGLIAAPLVYVASVGHLPPMDLTHSTVLLVVGGFLVGFGTRMGSGCTSGHGVCGIARLSKRSIAATLVFMAAGAATVFIARHIAGT